MIYKNREVAQNVLVMPEETCHRFFSIHLILQDSSKNLYIIVQEITNFTMYDGHFQAYQYHDIYINLSIWRCFTVTELESCFISRAFKNEEEKFYVLKRWI